MRSVRFRRGKTFTAEQIAEMQERLAALERLATSQQHQIADQQAEMARLRTLVAAERTPAEAEDELTAAATSATSATSAASANAPARAESTAVASDAVARLAPEPEAQPETGMRASRRAVLRWGSAAAAAGVAATAATVLGETHTAQAAGTAWQTGTVNADAMTLVQPGSGFSDLDILRLQQGTGQIFQQSTLKTALAAYDATGNNVGVYATSYGGTGLYGVTNIGTAAQGQAGLYAGLVGQATSTGTGVAGTSGSGIGVSGSSNSGIGGVFSGGLAPLALSLGTTSGAPTSGTHIAGEIYADSGANLFVCTQGGTPGTWNWLSSTRGQIVMLPVPIRVLDTRPTLWGDRTFHDVQVTGVNVGGIAVPGGVQAMVGNVTVTETTGTGHLTMYPQGTALPNASSINYVAGQTVANAIIVGLSSIGQVTIYVRGGGVKAILDVAGYIL